MSKITWFLVLSCFCSGPHLTKRDFFALGAACTIKIRGNQFDLLDSAIAECRRIEKKFSIFDNSSKLEILNSKGKITDAEFATLIRMATKVCSITNGRYDITCKPLLSMWGFYGNKFRIPNKTEIGTVKDEVDYKKIKISKDTIFLNGTKLDLGSLIQGYAADKISEIFKRHNVSEALIDIGGEIVAYGRKWRIGIKNPRKEELLQVVELAGAIATSGDYENFFINDGIRYHHIIDCLTGNPTKTSISTTVIAEDCTTADILSTALFITGPGLGKKIAKQFNAKVIWVDSNLQISHTEGFND